MNGNFIKLILPSLFVVGCAAKAELSERSKGLRAHYSPHADLVNGVSDLKEFYCSADKQKRSLEIKIRGLLPKMPAGLPIDEASKIRHRQRELLREYARTFFSLGVDRSNPSSEAFKEVALSDETVRGTPLASISDMASPNERLVFGNLFGTKESIEAQMLAIEKAQCLEQTDNPVCQTFIYFSATQPLLLSMTGLPEFLVENGSDVSLKYHRSPVFVKLTNAKMRIDLKRELSGSNPASDLLISREVYSKLLESNRGQSIHLAEELMPFEGPILRNRYTMLIPEKVQRNIFKELYSSGEEPNDQGERESILEMNSNQFGRGFFIKEDGYFNLSEAVSLRAHLWKAYLDRFTQVAEAQTDHPQIMNFKVSLDLELFCTYGRKVSDFLSN